MAKTDSQHLILHTQYPSNCCLCAAEAQLKSLRQSLVAQPFRCPICEGRGTVEAGFYNPGLGTTSTTREVCHSCGGAGIIWHPASERRP